MAGILTTLVGSFPLEPVKENFRKAFHDQVEIGIDYPVLPQLRDFVEMYLEPLVEQGVLTRNERGFTLSGSFDDAEPVVPWEYPLVVDVAKEMGVPYRLALTGPFTVASNIALIGKRPGDMFGSVLSDKEKFEELLQFMQRLAHTLSREVKPSMVCVDEPILSVIVGAKRILFGYTVGYIRESLDSVLAGFSGSELVGVHVCARLPTLLKDILLNLRYANFLDHEHHDVSENIDFYTREDLIASRKVLGFGVVSSKRPLVESFDEAFSLAKRARERYGDRLWFVKPDCGFRGLYGVRGGKEYEEIVLPKLRILVSVAEKLREET